MAAGAQFCGVVDALSDFQIRAMEALNARFNALLRLASLLEAAGDLRGFLPDISQLVPLASVNIELYANLQVSCPFLSLPPVGAGASSEAALASLRAQVTAAYTNLLKVLDLHPFSMMGKLQKKLANYQAKVDFSALASTDFLRCLQAVCAQAGSFSNLSATTPEAVVKVSNAYMQNFVTNQGQVLNDAAASKAGRVLALRAATAKLLVT